MNKKLTLTFKGIYYLSIGYFTYLMILITLQYVPVQLDAAFLNIKQEIALQTHYQIAFFSHVYTSIFVLILGITQFSNYIRTQFSKVHQSFGKLYIALILLIASPSGLIMAYYANGGFYAQLSFILQAIFWFIFTYKGYQYAKTQDWNKHQAFMLRSYALTLSAISLRLFKWIIVSTIELPPMDTYQIVAWLGWLFNLMVLEIYLIKK
ncbi:MAG: DUF2306 domain-containing protein [Saprospiraceae bacterium]